MATPKNRHPAHDELRERWTRTLLAVRRPEADLPPDTPSPYAYADDLLARWAEPHRRYHTTDHLIAVLDRIGLLSAHCDGPEEVATTSLAAWFHDAVHLPDRSTNEERSARLAERALPEAGLTPALSAEVARLVRLTATHDPAPGDASGEVLCDADLAVLAGSPQEYAAYAAAVREEYAFVPDDAFRAGRADVLRRLLDLPTLFRTHYGRERWEHTARRNLTTELELLTASGAGEADEAGGVTKR
ncbi:hypothetical protein [Streptomyces sp. DH37]|uniref:HD domain-containing protein n=1 Tax=Streptomyces sp. DH37 TaxID=3040122 RepID=UPI0024427EF1|nr:hypothetical protein [Streptomyces sp. DH37]MDG9704214.1 hypothetical protein [Streptomyces sp. DH37]